MLNLVSLSEKKATLTLLCFLLAISGFSQAIKYEISFPNADHHEAEISIEIPDIGSKQVKLLMSRSSPGRYALHEFAKNVYNVKAYDRNEKIVPYSRPNPHQWDFPSTERIVKITYTLFADRADGTYSAIDETHAHLNIPATFMYLLGEEGRPVEVKFNLREDLKWKVATQLKHQGEHVYSAPDLYYFLDSPVEISDFDLREWSVISNNKPYKIRLVMHHQGDSSEVSLYKDYARKIVDEQIAVFGELPNFDFDEYTFLACYLPHVTPDGMEHRNSTILTSRNPLVTGAKSNSSTLSHEFFHCWNVERIRPASLEPFNFQEQNMSGELWFAEGFTSYYTNLILCRAGIISQEEYIRGLSGSLNEVVNAPGRRYFSPIEMSYQAPFYDAASFLDPMNSQNTFISYYTYGAVLGLLLDLSIREKYPDKSLDSYMRLVWQRYGKPEVPYHLSDLESVLSELTDKEFADNFFSNYIHDSKMPVPEKLFENAGIILIQPKGMIDIDKSHITFSQGGAVIYENLRETHSLNKAGINKGDLILSMNNEKLSDERDLERILSRLKVGDRMRIEYLQRGNRKEKEVVINEHKSIQVNLLESTGKKPVKKVLEFRNSWLNSKTKNSKG